MDALDLVVIALLLGAAIHGLRLGATAQGLAFVGFLLGLAAGVALLLVVGPHVHSEPAKSLTALGLLLVPATVVGGLGRQLGFRAWARLRRTPLVRRVDAAIGIVFAVAGTLVICWLFASILVNSTLGGISSQIEGSGILRAVQRVMPPIPNRFATVERYLAHDGFPQVLVNVLPQPIGPVVLPDSASIQRAMALDAASTVKIVANGCPGIEQEGSGFVTSGGLVVTNAHVVAGTDSIVVEAPGQAPVTTTPLLFDPEFDLAVLRPLTPLHLRPLTIDPAEAERGSPAVVLGYPGGGPLAYGGAAILSRFVAEGRDIYDSSLTVRTVYEIEAVVRQGNSGGPLVSPSGEVLGVVFSRSTSQSTIGYALASPGVLSRVERAQAATSAVGTGSCIG